MGDASAAPLSIGRDHAKVQFQSVGKRRDTLRATSVLGNNDGLSPIAHVVTDPAGNKRLSVEVVDGAFEEALHLGRVQVDCDHMLDASDPEQVREHSRCDGATVGLLLRLSAIREVGEHSCATSGQHEAQEGLYIRGALFGDGNSPVILVAEPPLQAEIMMSSSIMVSLILGLPD